LKILNIGILAHVDAGKTTLTENILHLSGIISRKGRVDNGDTQTDNMEVERRRGISVRASTTSFVRNGIKFNLIDTPGHVDFVAEVERSLQVLDGVVLIISAVEGLQSQTRVLMDTIMAHKIPTIVFINKIDRSGADMIKTAKEAGLYMGNRFVYDSNEDALISLDDTLMEKYINNEIIPKELFQSRLAEYSKNGSLYPVFFGSALHGDGVEALLDAIPVYLPLYNGDSNAPLSGIVFKIDHTSGEKHVYVRLFAGSLYVRDKIVYQGKEEKVTRLAGLDNGKIIRADVIKAGDIGILYLKDMKVGDVIGTLWEGIKKAELGRPTLRVELQPQQPENKRALYEALLILADEDPILGLSPGDTLTLNMFGEIQIEILEEILIERYNIPIQFLQQRTIFMEQPTKMSKAVIGLNKDHFFRAGLGFTIEPLPQGSGLIYETKVSYGDLFLSFQKAVEEAVLDTCKNGLYGWEITDTKISLIYSEYDSVTSTPSDYRNLTPMVLMEAFSSAEMILLEPVLYYELRVPESSAGKALYDLNRKGAIIDDTYTTEDELVVNGLIPADNCKNYSIQVASYTEGRGLFITKFHSYKPTDFDENKINKEAINIATNQSLYKMHKLGTF